MPRTDTAIRKAKPRSKPYKLSDSNGLYLLVSPNGGKWWRFRYRYAGKKKLLSLGNYPDVALKTACDRRDQERRKLADRIEPVMALLAVKRELMA